MVGRMRLLLLVVGLVRHGWSLLVVCGYPFYGFRLLYRRWRQFLSLGCYIDYYIEGGLSVKVAIRGKGEHIRYVDIQDLPVTKELVKFKKETNQIIDELRKELAETKQEFKRRIKDLEHYVTLKEEGGQDEKDII